MARKARDRKKKSNKGKRHDNSKRFGRFNPQRETVPGEREQRQVKVHREPRVGREIESVSPSAKVSSADAPIRRGGGPQAFLERVGKGEVGRTRGAAADGGSRERRGRGDRREGADRRVGGGSHSPRYKFKPSYGPPEQHRPPKGSDLSEDLLEQKRNRRKSAAKGPKTDVVVGEIQKNAKGFGFVLAKPEDVFVPPHFAEKLLTGDIVRVTIESRSREVLDLEIVSRAIKSFVGTYEAGFDARFVILSDRTMREEVVIRERPNLPGLRHGHKVLVEIVKYEPHLEGRILRDFGPKLAPKFDTLAVVVRSQWPQEFSPEAMSMAAQLSEGIQAEAAENGYKGRKDLRSKPFVTIDGKDSRDFDDAVLVEKTASGYVLYVAIADVAEFVHNGSRLDDEAYARATSVYFPEWVIPMLPEALSNGACSLRPNEDKLTLTCEMHYDLSGKKRSIKIYESVIRSHRRCIYEDVHEEWKRGDEFWKVPFELYQLIRFSRNKRGALDLELPEAKVVLDDDSDTIDIRKVERLDSHRLIEEFMIAANESVTEVMEREGWPFVYRVHEPPKTDALARFERFASALGFKPKLGDGSSPKLLAAFIDTLKENPLAQTLYYLMLRSLKQARYDTENLKHFGLASQAYTHFTSPIRRYPDLMVHRILKRFTRHQPFHDDELDEVEEYLFEACDHCSKRERLAETLDRTVTKVKKARFMAKHVGEEFEAQITNVSETGLFVELKKYFIEGLVPIAELENDYFDFFEDRMMLKGKRTGKKYRIGDMVAVSVLRIDVDNGFIDFTLAENLEAAEST